MVQWFLMCGSSNKFKLIEETEERKNTQAVQCSSSHRICSHSQVECLSAHYLKCILKR